MSAVSIFFGSVYGNAQHVAEQVQSHLESNAISSTIIEEPSVQDLIDAKSVLVITSTTGQGDIPPNLEWWVNDLREQFPLMNNKPFAVAGLGDSSYGDSYCGGGKQVYTLLEELQGSPVGPLLEVDAIETLEPEEDVIKWIDNVKDKLAS